MGLVVSKGRAKDFWTGQPPNLNKCQNDRIFPKSLYKDKYKEQVNSILNRTLISEKTNKKKNNIQPSEFFEECLEGHGNNEAKFLETLSSHFISPNAYAALKHNNSVGIPDALFSIYWRSPHNSPSQHSTLRTQHSALNTHY